MRRTWCIATDCERGSSSAGRRWRERYADGASVAGGKTRSARIRLRKISRMRARDGDAADEQRGISRVGQGDGLCSTTRPCRLTPEAKCRWFEQYSRKRTANWTSHVRLNLTGRARDVVNAHFVDPALEELSEEAIAPDFQRRRGCCQRAG